MADRPFANTAHVDDDLAALALGILDEAERDHIEAHLSHCARCRSLLGDYETTAARARDGIVLPVPPTSLWDRIEEEIREPAPVAASAPPSRGSRTAPRWQPVLAIAAALAFAGLLAWNIALQLDRGDDDLAALLGETNDAVFTLAAPSPASSAQGRIFMSDDRTRGVVAVVGLPELPEGRSYAVWLVAYDQERVLAGTFAVDAGGNGVAPLSLPASSDWWGTGGPAYAGLAVTEVAEDAPGAPASADLLAGPLY